MAILNVHIQKEVTRYFFFVLATVIGIYLIADFFERIDNFISAGLKVQYVLIYYLCNLPIIVAQMLPVCLLLAVIIALGLMNKHNEIIALKSCGIGFVSLLRPVLALSVLVTGLMFFLSEIIVPITVPVSNKIWIEDIKKKNIVSTREKDIWMKGTRSITHIKHYNPVEKNIYGISEYMFDESFKLASRLDAKKGSFTNKGWILSDILEQTRDQTDGSFRISLKDEEIRPMAISPEDLITVVKKSEEMSFNELREYIKKVEGEGYDAAIYQVDLYGKTAFPFVCMIMALVGAGIGVKKGVKEGLPIGIAYGIGIAFLYWVFNSFALSLGYGGVLPPIIAAWIPNLLFCVWGIYLALNN